MGAAYCVSITFFPAWIKFSLMFMLILHGSCLVKRYVLLLAEKSIIACCFNGEFCQIQDKSGRYYWVKLNDNSILTRYFVLLNFQCIFSRSNFRIILFPAPSFNSTLHRLLVMF